MDGYVAAYRGNAILSNLLMMERTFHSSPGSSSSSSSGVDETTTAATSSFYKVDHAIYMGINPTSYFTLAIKFDKFPKDLSWTLATTSTDSIIMMHRPLGWYNDKFEMMSIVEKIPVFTITTTTTTTCSNEYKFTIRDTYPCDDDATQICGDREVS